MPSPAIPRPWIPGRVLVALAIAIATAAGVAIPAPARAATATSSPRVVIVVGPAGSATADYLSHARAYARQARAYGATVAEVYTPRATWPRVLRAAQGANVFIYLGHGNGWPSPYRPWQGLTKDGLGLNPEDDSGNVRVKYYGESLVAASLRLAPGAVVLLNRLCYASGNAEPGMAEPSWATAVKRVDNYAAGFLRTGADVVLADGHTSLGYELAALFGPSRRFADIWTADPDFNGNLRSFDSRRTPGARTHLDPDRPAAGFYRSLTVRPGAVSGMIRMAALTGSARSAARLRSAPSTGTVLRTIAAGGRVVVRGPLRMDREGRTWAPVTTIDGRAGWVAAWLFRFTGTTRAQKAVVLRAKPSVNGARRATIGAGRRVEVVATHRDGAGRMWLGVQTGGGRSGWIAGWLAKP